MKRVCRKMNTKKYQTRKSPPFQAANCPGLLKKGKDGMYKSIDNVLGIFRWVKVAGK